MLIIPILLLFIYVQSQISSSPSLCTGQITPITSLPSTTTSPTYTVSLNFTLAAGTNLQSGLSLISFSSSVSQQFSFNSSIVSVNSTGITVSATPLSSTYFWLLSLQYIVSYLDSIRILKGCYYCTNLLTGTGPRSQTFTNLTFTNLTAPLQQITVISGLKMNNTQANNLSITVSSNLDSLPIIETKVSTTGYIIIQWVCLSVLLYKPFLTVGEVYFFGSSPVSHSLGMSNPPSNKSMFFMSNTMFFGISALSFQMTTTLGFIFSISTTNYINPLAITSNSNLLYLMIQQFFIANDSCMSPTGPFYDYTLYSCYSSCSQGTYSDSNGYCIPCSTPLGNCLTCSGSVCLTCDSTLFRSLNSSNLCGCNITSFDNSSVCILCSSMISNCSQCINTTYCIICDPPFSASGGICVCPVDTYLSNGNCSQLMGCLVSDSITSGLYCITCDKSRNFQILINKTCVCIKYTSYNSISGACEGVCGNGVSLGKICDDADTNDTNGCANNCTVNAGYHCINPNQTSPSICVLISSYNASYLYATKIINEDTAVLYFNLGPDDPIFSSMNFSKFITTSIPNSKITASYSNNILTVQVTYTQSIQATSQNVTISFDQTLVYAPSISLTITPCGINYKLVFNSLENLNTVVTMIADLVGGLAFLFAIVSSVLGYKLIGLQLLLPIQLVYFSLACLNIPSSTIGSLYGLSFANGFNKVKAFQLSKQLNSNSGLIVLQTNNQFLANFNYMIIPLILLFLMVLVSRCWISDRMLQLPLSKKQQQKKQKQKALEKQKAKLKKQAQQQQKKQNVSKDEKQPKQQQNKIQQIQENKKIDLEQKSFMQKLYYFVIDRLLITYWIMLLQNFIFSFTVQLLSENNTQQFFSMQLNVFLALIFLFLILMGLVFVFCKILQNDRQIHFRCKKKNYPILLIVCYLISIIILVSFFYFGHNIGTYLLIPPIILPVALIFRMKPHGSLMKYRSIIAILCQAIPIIAVAIYLLNISSSMGIPPLISAFILLVFMFLTQILSILLLILTIRQRMLNKKTEQIINKAQNENTLDQIVKDSIKNQLLNNSADRMIDWKDGNIEEQKSHRIGQPKNKFTKVTKNQNDQDSEVSEQDQLLMLKMKLKRQMMQKRGALYS